MKSNREKGATGVALTAGPALKITMLTHFISTVVTTCCRFAWPVVIAMAVLSGLAFEYARTHFAITTDSSQLISARLPWRERELAVDRSFPQRTDLLLAVIDGTTPEATELAARRLTAALTPRKDVFQLVRRPDGGAFFARNGLLFSPLDELRVTTEGLIRAQPFLGTLANDPSVRGMAKALSFLAVGVQLNALKPDDFMRPVEKLSGAFEAILSEKPAEFSWTELMTGRPASSRDLRKFIAIKPVLDFGALEPGDAAATAVRQSAYALGLTPANGVSVRLTGPVALADEEFGTIADGAALNGIVTLFAILTLLWLALRSARIILAVFLSLAAGLVMTAACGLMLVGAFNLISVAFAVLFVGIGVDFGIQLSVRYREERHASDDLRHALSAAAAKAGVPLALAASATACAFYSFLPTDYRGISELGLIAGTGMMIAFVTSITLLPALLMLLRPKGEPAEIGYGWLAGVDRFLARHRMIVLGATGIAVAAGLPLLPHVRFDFNPLNLRSRTVESVSTLLDLMKDPATGPNTIDILAPSLEAGNALVPALSRLPEVDHVVSLTSFIPDDQPQKLALIQDAAALLGPTLNPSEPMPQPGEEDERTALIEAADKFDRAGEALTGQRAGTTAARFAAVLRRVALATPAHRARVRAAFIPGIELTLEQLRAALTAQPVTLATLPPDLTQDWLTADGRARIEVAPKGDANDNAVLRTFASAVRAVAPEATGGPVSIQESANTVVTAFIQAGILALISITILLYIVLGRVVDVLLTLIPLVLAGVVTLEICVLIDLPLNFANIIALPLLLGVGVAFKIYYVMAWRSGVTSLLASSLTRAVFFSALTTATAFGSLWLSNHPGTSSMGKLLSLSLVTTLLAAVLFQPILMGPPREVEKGVDPADAP